MVEDHVDVRGRAEGGLRRGGVVQLVDMPIGAQPAGDVVPAGPGSELFDLGDLAVDELCPPDPGERNPAREVPDGPGPIQLP